MRSSAFFLFAAICCGTAAQAQTCPDLYNAIKREAMYCDFFCDQRRLQPMQMVYEKQCIKFVIPAALLAFENPAPDPATPREFDANESSRLIVRPN